MKFGAIIVNYNLNIDESKTYNCFKKNFDGDVIVIDNSTSEKFTSYNQKICSDDNIDYKSFGENIGLSKAYNYGVTHLKRKNVDFIITLDNDTNIPNEYFELLNSFNFDSKTVYAPLVYNQNKQLTSPTYHDDNYIIDFFKQRKYGNLKTIQQLIPNKNIYAINSGLIIPVDLFESFSYNEDLFIDCVDHNICKELYVLGYTINIFPVNIYQNYSTEEIGNNSLKNNEHRLLLRLNDVKTYNSKTYFINKLLILTMYSLRSKDIRYFKYIFR